MRDAPPEVVIEAVTTAPTRRARGLWVHLLGLALVVAALGAVSDLRSSWTSDDGAYAVQAELLRETGEWAYPNRHPDADPGAKAVPIANSTRTDEGNSYPYAKHPVWAVTLAASSSVFGETVGLHVPAWIGLLAAAGVAWALAVTLDRRRLAPWAFWAVAAGPLLVEATALWAHTVAAAVGGVVAILVVREARQMPSPWLRVLAPLAVAGLGLVRAEATLLGIAAAATLAGVALAGRGPVFDRVLRAVVTAGPMAAAAVAGRRLNARLVEVIVEGVAQPSADALAPVGFVRGRLTGTLRTFVDGAGGSVAGLAAGLLAVGLAFIGGRALASGDRRAAAVAGGAAVALITVRTAMVGPADLAGFLVAAPIVAFGAGAWRPSRSGPEIRAVVGLVVTTWGLTVLTQYQEGGGREWGGRYLLTVVVPATVVAVVAISDLWPDAGRRSAAVAMVVLVAVPTIGGLMATHQVARDARNDAELLARQGDVPVIVTAPYVPRLAWRGLPEADWMVGRPDEIEGLLEALRPTLDGPVVIIGPGADDLDVDGYRSTIRAPNEVVLTPEG